MLQMATGPVTILGYHQPTQRRDGQEVPMTRGDGSKVEMCTFKVDGEERDRSIVLDKAVNGSRPPAGARVSLQLETNQEPVSAVGTDRVRWVVKNKIVAATPVKES